MVLVSLRCGDWLISTLTKTELEPFGLSLWSLRKTNPESETTHCYLLLILIIIFMCNIFELSLAN